MPTEPWIGPVERLGSFALLAFCIIYGLRVSLPRAVDSICAAQNHVAKALDAQSKMLAKLSIVIFDRHGDGSQQLTDIIGVRNDS